MMRRAHGWTRVFRLFRSAEEEAAAELEAHLAMRADRLEAEGLSREEAVRRARSEVGDAEAAVRATVRAEGPAARWRLVAWLDGLGADLRFAIRALRRRPGFGLTVVGVLTLVIALVSVVLALVSVYLLRGLPYPAADRVVLVTRTPVGRPTMSSDAPVPSGLNTIDWPRTDSVLEYSAAWELDGFGLLSDEAEPAVVPGAWVTAGFFPIVGAETRLGRVFNSDEVATQAPVAVISHGLWQRRFGADPDVIGRSLRVFSNARPAETESFEIIGVLASDTWLFTAADDLFLPLRGRRRPVLARLAPGVPTSAAEAHLTRIARERLPRVDPRWSMRVTPLQEALYTDLRPALGVLAAGVLLLLAIGGANVLVLLLIRVESRRRELSIRASLGAGRARLVRQLAVEGALLAAVAGGAGLALGAAALEAIGPLVPTLLAAPVPGGATGLTIDPRVIVAVAVACVGIAGSFGLAALTASRLDFGRLRGGRGTAETGDGWLRSALVAAEVALSVALLIGAGILLRAALELGHRDLGFRAEGIQVASVALREAAYPNAASRVAFFRRVLTAYGRAAPASGKTAISSRYPYRIARGELLEAEAMDPPVSAEIRAVHHAVSQDYFRVLEIPVLAGRNFASADNAEGEPVIVIDRSLAERLWPGRDPLGRSLRTGSWDEVQEDAPWRTVVGVVGDVRTTRTGTEWPDTYVPFAQAPASRAYVLIAAPPGEEPGTAVARLRRVVAGLDERQPVEALEPLDRAVAGELARPRVLTGLLTAFAACALLLALFGLYAVVAYAASRRRKEAAIRLALGARPSEVVRLLVKGGLAAAGAGAGAGLALALAASRLLASQTYGLPVLRPWTWAGLVALALAAAALAVRAAARRGSAADPAALLREE